MRLDRDHYLKRRGPENFCFLTTLTKVDVKKSLQRLVNMELKSGTYSLHDEEEMRIWLLKDMCPYLSDKGVARDAVEWAFKIAIKEGYVCRSQHDQNSPVPMFYIPKVLLNLTTGPKLDRVAMAESEYIVAPGVSALFEEQPEEIIDD